MTVSVRPLVDGDRAWVHDLVDSAWGLPVVTPTGAFPAPERLAGLVAEVDGARAGAVTWVPAGDAWEVVTVNAVVEGAGVGRALLEAVRHEAAAAGAARVWLITTDDNPGALAFYERIGMRQGRRHPDHVDTVRVHKPGSSGYRDAIELEWVLKTGGRRPTGT